MSSSTSARVSNPSIRRTWDRLSARVRNPRLPGPPKRAEGGSPTAAPSSSRYLREVESLPPSHQAKPRDVLIRSEAAGGGNPGPLRLGVPPKGLNTTLVYWCPYSPVKVAYRPPEAASTGAAPAFEHENYGTTVLAPPRRQSSGASVTLPCMPKHQRRRGEMVSRPVGTGEVNPSNNHREALVRSAD